MPVAFWQSTQRGEPHPVPDPTDRPARQHAVQVAPHLVQVDPSFPGCRGCGGHHLWHPGCPFPPTALWHRPRQVLVLVLVLVLQYHGTPDLSRTREPHSRHSWPGRMGCPCVASCTASTHWAAAPLVCKPVSSLLWPVCHGKGEVTFITCIPFGKCSARLPSDQVLDFCPKLPPTALLHAASYSRPSSCCGLSPTPPSGCTTLPSTTRAASRGSLPTTSTTFGRWDVTTYCVSDEAGTASWRGGACHQ